MFTIGKFKNRPINIVITTLVICTSILTFYESNSFKYEGVQSYVTRKPEEFCKTEKKSNLEAHNNEKRPLKKNNIFQYHSD